MTDVAVPPAPEPARPAARSAAPEEPTGWERFWFTPEPTSTLALFRIAVGLLMLAWTLWLIPDLFAFYGDESVLPTAPHYVDDGLWGLFQWVDSDAAILVGFFAMLASSVGVLVGFQTRLSAAILFFCLVSFERRNPFVLNSGDGLVRLLVIVMMVAPSGAALSVDRWRRHRERFWEFPLRAPWALRLLQIQVSVLYLSTVWQKVRGTTWNDGTAVSYAQRLGDLERFHVPDFISDSVLLANFQTFGTLAVELGIAVLVWTKWRNWALLAGLFLHAGIDVTIRVGLFSYAVFISYIAFVPPGRAEQIILGVRDRLRARRPGTARVGAGQEQVEPAG